MASSLPSFCSLSKPLCKHKARKYPLQIIISQSHIHDEGKPTNIVDANLRVLRERIEEVQKKERRSNTRLRFDNGWTKTKYGYDEKHNMSITAMLWNWIEIVRLISSALGLVFLTGSLCIFLVAFLVHLYK